MIRIEKHDEYKELIAVHSNTEYFRMSNEFGEWRIISSDLIGSTVETMKILVTLANDSIRKIESLQD